MSEDANKGRGPESRKDDDVAPDAESGRTPSGAHKTASSVGSGKVGLTPPRPRSPSGKLATLRPKSGAHATAEAKPGKAPFPESPSFTDEEKKATSTPAPSTPAPRAVSSKLPAPRTPSGRLPAVDDDKMAATVRSMPAMSTPAPRIRRKPSTGLSPIPSGGRLAPPASTPPPLPSKEEGARPSPVMRIGPYRVEREIGSGGMSVVYRSVQENLARTVAIKVLRAEIAAQGHLAERFDREALSLAALQHENILHIYDYRTDDQLPYMVTEYLEGVDLYDILERHDRVPADVAAIVGLQVARALDYAHSRGVVHRDVKPANIMFTVSGGIKLMDFGIARQDSFKDLTQAGAGVGTPAYMSPEQILGENLDGRTDIWSLGVVLYQMLTGRKPFQQDDDHTVLHNIRVVRPTPPRHLVAEIPRELERIVLRCLEKSPRDRYPVAQQLALALERFAASRLAVPYKVRLVSWLESLGELTTEQAQAALPADGDEGLRAQWRQEVPPPKGPLLGIPPAGWVAAVSAVLFLTLLIVVLANWPSHPRGATGAASAADPMEGPPPVFAAPANKQGGLRVNARPWARVLFDGRRRETTPFARPLSLTVGTHRVRLEHPTLGHRDRTVQVVAGKVVTLSVDLTRQAAPPPRRPMRRPPSPPGKVRKRAPARRVAPRGGK